jgi:acetyl-CoA acetyltransferase
MTLTKKAVIAGIGEAPLTPSGSGRSADAMTVEAALKACADAGISPDAVDGAVKYTYDTSINTYSLLANLGAKDLRLAVEVPFGGGSCAALIDVARSMIMAGRAQAVICYRTVVGDEWIKQLSSADPQRPYYMDTANYLRPVGWTGYLGIFAAFYSEYASKYSISREALFETVNLMRSNAAQNTHAVHKAPVARDEYFNSPLTVGPFTEFDEFAVADTSCAVLVTAEDIVPIKGNPTVDILASAQSHGSDPRGYFDSRVLTANLIDSPASMVAAKLYEESGLQPSDIDVGLVYDCTSFTLLFVAEQFGLCGPGEAAERVLAGDFSTDGTMPLNPHGGDTAGGYTHGFRHILEAVKQVRGIADNQVSGARTALVGGPQAGPTSGLILQRREIP